MGGEMADKFSKNFFLDYDGQVSGRNYALALGALWVCLIKLNGIKLPMSDRTQRRNLNRFTMGVLELVQQLELNEPITDEDWKDLSYQLQDRGIL